MKSLYTLLALAAFTRPIASGAFRPRANDPTGPGHWVDTWTAMPQLTETSNLPPAPFNQPSLKFANATLRQTLHMSIGGPQIRVVISNAFSDVDLFVTSASVALPANGAAGTSAIVANSTQKLTFSGTSAFEIPNGAEVYSDPLEFEIKPQSVLAVSVYLARGQTSESITSHPGSRTTSWFARGEQTGSTNLTGTELQSAAHWYFLSAVQAWVPTDHKAIALVGDSITDGRGSDTDRNNRWPDLLLARMQNNSATASIAVLNQAAGGNRVLADGLGPNALGRFNRDVLAQPGVAYALVFEGVNDIGVADTSAAAQQAIGDRLIQAFQQLVTRAHAFNIPIFGATITPFSAPATSTVQPYSNPEREKTRQRVNAWIRNGGFDAVVDFDAAVRDPQQVNMLKTEYNSGDYLHLNVAGYQAMADTVDLGIFK